MSLRHAARFGSLLTFPVSVACTLDVYTEPSVDAGIETTFAVPDAAPVDNTSCGSECETPTCEDGIRNQDEDKVDCGGPCEACGTTATCNDGKKNQGETGIDCGGVCDPCELPETCSDNVRNQDEEGVDCGGVCDPCPTCSDAVRNQGEEGTDCGGPCEPCPALETCDDGIQNQGEESTDCGGPCAECPTEETCSDGVLNQDEVSIDCGGACEICPTCEDGLRNQNEAGVDCGGPCGLCPLPGEVRFIGNITQGGALPEDFAMWNQLTPENEGKWRYLEPLRDEMSWERMDAYYEYTRTRGIPLKAHTFCWGSQAPTWISELEPEEQAEEVEEYIQSFCERYPDIEMIDVVNEPDHAPPSYMDALGGSGETGHDWVLQCFEWAREHCPDATLILNDYNVLRWDTDAYIAIAEKVKAVGLLDAVGEQGHGLETIAFAELNFNLTKLAALELPIYISEYDVDLLDDAQQLAVFQQQFPLFYNHPQVVGITIWGYMEGQTWRPNTHLLRYDGSPRPAFDWLKEHYLSTERTCGNGECESGESCTTCSLDCGTCSPD